MCHFTILLLIAMQVIAAKGDDCICKDSSDWQNANICQEVFKELSVTLSHDSGNLYRMKQAFFYAPSADPVLIQVTYNISYSENITEDLLPYCENLSNSSAITINETKIIRGWTSRGVYYVINPLILSKTQMVLPFAVLRLINKHWKSTTGSPEVDTFLWDGSYELPTLLINLHITSLPCIPSEEVFNCTLEELNAYLKTYATSQESKQSAAIHAGDIAYTLSENRMLYPNLDQSDISFELIIYCVFGYFLLMVLGFHLLLSNNMNLLKSAYENFFEHVEVVFPAVLIGLLFVICEFIATTVYLKDLVAFTTFHMYVWFPSLFLILYIFYKVVRLCCKKDKDKSDYIKCILTVVTGTMLLFLIHIYCYALPTFLLLLVYPTKVIAVVAYLATFIFAASIMFSISLRLIITFVFHFRTIGRCTSIMMIINAIVVFLNPIFMFTIVIHFLYALVLGEASAISAGPYTVLSLIPTAAISAVSWLFKNKVFSSTAEEEDEQPKDDNEDDTGDNENGGTHSEADGEALRLVVNEDTPASRNGREVNSYGATGNN